MFDTNKADAPETNIERMERKILDARALIYDIRQTFGGELTIEDAAIIDRRVMSILRSMSQLEDLLKGLAQLRMIRPR